MREIIILYDILVTGIELPAAIVAAINRKTEQYYIAEEYKFRVEREKRESERKKIEAEGIREFQQTVSQGISDSYLRWRGIEATLQLSQSTNAKVVIIGSGKDGLPIILNTDTSPPAGSTQPAENDTSKQRPTAAGPAVPLEKTPAEALATPAERIPPVTSATQPAASYSFCCCSGGAALVLAAQSGDDQVLSPELVGRNGAEDSGSLKSAGREVGPQFGSPVGLYFWPGSDTPPT